MKKTIEVGDLVRGIIKRKGLMINCECGNEDLHRHISFGVELESPKVQVICPDCEKLIAYYPLNAKTREDLEGSILFTNALPEGIAVGITENTILIGTEKEKDAQLQLNAQ